MILIRIILLVFFILSGIISLYHNLVILFLVALFGFIMTIVWVLIKDYNIDIDGIIEARQERNIQKQIQREERKELEEKIKLENKRKIEEEKKEYNIEVKQQPSTIVIDTNKFIIFLLIVIIIILLYNNGILYKCKLVTNDNLLEIQSSTHLSLENKIKIADKIATEDINKYINKPIWYMLNN